MSEPVEADALQARSERSWPLVVALPAVLSILCYLPSLSNQFTYDDKVVLVDSKGTRSLSNLEAFLSRRYYSLFGEKTYRPVVSLSYLVEYAVAGPRAYPIHHLTNVLLHGLAVAAVGLLALRLIPWWPGAFAAAMIFALHPVQGEVVNSISFREDILCAIFLAGMVLAYMVGRNPGGSGAWAAAVLLCAALAMLSKETAAVALVLLVLYEGFCGTEETAMKRVARRWPLIVGTAGVCAAIAVFALAVIPNPELRRSTDAALSYREVLLTLPKATLAHLGTAVLPLHLSPIYSSKAVTTPLSGWFMAGGLFIVGWMGLIAWLRRCGAVAFGLAWTALLLLPASGVLAFALPAGSLRADRFLYLPMIGMALTLGAGCWRLRDSIRSAAMRWAAWAAFALIVLLWVSVAQSRTPAWRNDFTLFSAALRVAPDDAMVHNDLSLHYESIGDIKNAAQELGKSLALQRTPLALTNLGRLLVQQGGAENIQRARKRFEEALEVNPRFVPALTNLGHIFKLESDELMTRASELRAQGDEPGAELFEEQARAGYPEGFALWEEALRINPSFVDARYYSGNLHLKLGQIDEAKAAFEETLRLEPQYALAHLQLGTILLYRVQTEQGCEHLREALAIGLPPSAVQNARDLFERKCSWMAAPQTVPR